MHAPKTDEEVWEFYQIILKQKKSGLNVSQFCKRNNIDYKLFTNYLYRIEFTKYSNPELYKKLMDLVTEYKQVPMERKSFCEKYNIKESQLVSALSHFRCLSIIQRLEKEKGVPEDKPMTFIPLKNEPLQQIIVPEMTRTPEPEPEVLEAKNSVELIIDKGVRVIVSPEVPPMKLIKIIELLKDL